MKVGALLLCCVTLLFHKVGYLIIQSLECAVMLSLIGLDKHSWINKLFPKPKSVPGRFRSVFINGVILQLLCAIQKSYPAELVFIYILLEY